MDAERLTGETVEKVLFPQNRGNLGIEVGRVASDNMQGGGGITFVAHP